MFNVFALLLDDALKPATPLTNGAISQTLRQFAPLMGCLHDLANVQQTSSKCFQNTGANAGRLLDRVNTLSVTIACFSWLIFVNCRRW